MVARIFLLPLAGVFVLGADVSLLAQPQPDPDYVLSAGSAQGDPGDTVDISCFLSNPNGQAVAAFSYGLCDFTDAVEAIDFQLGGELLQLNGGAGPDFVSFSFFDEGFLLNVVFTTPLAPPFEVLNPGVDNELSVITYTLLGGPSVYPLSYCEEGAAALFLTLEDLSTVLPQATSGAITIAGAPFVRGDFDGDGQFSGLTDGVASLAFQFQGGAPPLCSEAADTDGNGIYQGLVDAVYGLQHQFLSGPPPPAPYPDCGADPDPGSSLGCDQNGCP